MGICSKCGADLPSGVKFCKKCGAKAESQVQSKACKKCGAAMAADDTFCGECGTPVGGAPATMVCPKCNEAVPDGFAGKFCDKCGHKLDMVAATGKSGAAGAGYAKELTIKRMVRATEFQTPYRVTVDGNSLGELTPGATVKAGVSSDTAKVEIVSTKDDTDGMTLVLRLGNNPTLAFKINQLEKIAPTVQGAEILEKQHIR